MPLDERVMVNLAFSLVSIASLLVCAHYAYPSQGLVGALRWASYTALLGIFAQAVWCVWERYRPRGRGGEDYSGVEIDGNGLETGVEVHSRVVTFPELNLTSVWVYVYGAGLLLFVSLYCLSGIEAVSTCWWVMGMTPLAVDELVSHGENRVFVGLLLLMVYVNTVYLWFLEDGASDELFGYDPWKLLGAVVAPVLCPLFFFSFRSTTRVTNVTDVSRLCMLALPFMMVMALCVLVWTEGRATGRRALNATMVETSARFYVTDVQGDPPPYYFGTLCMLFSPFAAAAVLWQLVRAVTEGYSSEFITALLLALNVRHWAFHDSPGFASSFLGVIASGLAFVLALCRRG